LAATYPIKKRPVAMGTIERSMRVAVRTRSFDTACSSANAGPDDCTRERGTLAPICSARAVEL
jgi:hypothetical protein